jgi:hypothetical protein
MSWRRGGTSWPSRVFLSGQAVSLLGDGLAVLAIPLLVLGLTRSPLISALSAASQTLGYRAVGLPAGVLVDRLDAWRVLVVMDAVRAVAFAGLYLLWVTGAARLWAPGTPSGWARPGSAPWSPRVAWAASPGRCPQAGWRAGSGRCA